MENRKKHGYSQETLCAVRQINLYEYLSSGEPDELVRISTNNYCTRTHDSLKFKAEGSWYWWSRGIGGRGALDYLTKVRGMAFVDAMETLSGSGLVRGEYSAPAAAVRREPEKKPFALPPKNADNRRVIGYLTSARGLPYSLVKQCISSGKLYEDQRHNCVFVGFDSQGKPSHAALRGTGSGSHFRGDVTGSDKSCGFSFSEQKGDAVCVFESAVDLLSYLALYENCLQGVNLIALNGVYKRDAGGTYKPPAALESYLKAHPETRTIVACLDNDDVGRDAAKGLTEHYSDRYEIKAHIPSGDAKDWNDVLKAIRERQEMDKTDSVRSARDER